MPEVVEREPDRAARAVGRAAHALALLATTLPWSRFGAGSEPFGAWSADPGWSMLVVVAALVGTLLPFARRVAGGDRRAWEIASLVAGVLVVVGSVLAIARPPAFTSPWLGPWVALATGLAAVAASGLTLARERTRERVRS